MFNKTICFDLYLIGHYLPDICNIRHKREIHKMTFLLEIEVAKCLCIKHFKIFVSNIFYITIKDSLVLFNPLNPELNPICYLLALLAYHFLHVSRIMVKSLTLRLPTSYIYGAPILDVSRSHTTTHHSR